MATFNLPSPNGKRRFTSTKFVGVDFHNSPENVESKRSPWCVNMIRDKNGSVRKRMGYEKIRSFDGKINGGCFINGAEIIHAGNNLYKVDTDGTVTYLTNGMADKKSVFMPYGNTLYILTGNGAMYVNDKFEVDFLSRNAYVPTVIVSKSPSGGGTLHEDYNMISYLYKEQFLSDGKSTVYRLEKQNILGVDAVYIMDENGEMQLLPEEEYTVSMEEGTVTFVTAPPVSPVVGMDNVIIEVGWNGANEDIICGCTVGVIYGGDGKTERLFLGGNKDYPGVDFFSEAMNFSYFPQMNYSKLSAGNIIGYSIFNGSLYTHIDEDATSGKYTIVKRDECTTEDGNTAFVISDRLTAPTLITPFTARSFGGESLYLSKDGVYSLTVSDVTDEKVCQLRSAFLGNVISNFTNAEKENAYSVVFNNFYMVSVGGKMLILDGENKSYFSGTPLCSYQYECFYWENIPARIMWTDGEHLFFGSENGDVYRFFSNVDSVNSYTDNGEAVSCVWDTCDICGDTFFRNKNFVSVAAKIGMFFNTGVEILAKPKGSLYETPVYSSFEKGRYFDFSRLDFNSVSFLSKGSEITICAKARIRNVPSVRFRLINNNPEPFSLYSFGTEYVEKGNYLY